MRNQKYISFFLVICILLTCMQFTTFALAENKSNPDNVESTSIFDELGTISNIKMAGNNADSNKVYAAPSLGIAPPNLTVDAQGNLLSADEQIAAMQALKENPVYNTNAYREFSTFAIKNDWSTVRNGYLGYNMRYIYAPAPDSILYGENVTQLVKPYNLSVDATKAPKLYEFDIDKGGTVYISFNSQKDRTRRNIKSEYIESLNKGWTHDYDTIKYGLYVWNNTIATSSDQTKKAYIPNGTTVGAWANSGSVYYKHFKAGEHVEIPAYSETKDEYSETIFVVWDACNEERHLYDVDYRIASGESISLDFDKEIKIYDITVPQGTVSVPTLDVSATKPVNIRVNAPSVFADGKATVTMSAELEEGEVSTYTFNFYVDSSPDDDARVKGVTFNGVAYEELNMYTKNYEVSLAYGESYPMIAAETNSATANVVITQPADNGGIGLVEVISQNGNYSNVYTFTFTKLDYVPAEASVMKVKDGKKSIVTIVHDDGDISTTMPYLNREMLKNNLRTTVGMVATRIADTSGTLSTTDIEKWTPYFENGRFNLASHSYTHTYMGQSDSVAEPAQEGRNGETISATFVGKMSQEVKKSQEVLREAFPNQKVNSFIKPGVSYPVDKEQVSDEAYKMIADTYVSMRNTGGGIDTIPPSDWYNIKSLMVNSSDDPASSDNHTAAYWIERVDETIERGGWLTFLFHEIRPDSRASGLHVSQSKASIFFDKLGDRVERGDVWNAFFDEATMYIKEAQTASVVAKDYTNERGYVTLDVTDTMDNKLYNYPITIKTAVPQNWRYVKNVQGINNEIKKTFVENGVTYVYANVVPDMETAHLSQVESGELLTSITIDGKDINGYDPTKYHYNVKLPVGTTQAPVVAASGAVVTQATLIDGEGAAMVNFDGNIYTIYFEVEKDGPVVLLKLDDLREGSAVRKAFKNAVAYCDEVGIKANVGVIASSLNESESDNKSTYFNEIKSYAAGGHEIWNHGYYHDVNAAKNAGYQGEFKDGTVEDQVDQLNRSTALFKEKIGLEPTSFGAPGNSTNSNTATAFNNYNAAGTYAPFTTAYYYDAVGVTGMRGFTEALAFEGDETDDGVWNMTLNYKKFVARYQENKDMEYMILQTHPREWGQDANATHYKVFKDQIDYLLMNGAKFMTASEYDAMLDVGEEEKLLKPTFGVYNKAYPIKKAGDDEYLVYKTSTSNGVPSLSVNFPDEVKGTNASVNYPSAKWYKIDFDMNMKVDHKFSFLFRYSFTQNSAYIPNYYDPEQGILTKSSNVPVKSGEKLHLSFLFDLQNDVRYFFINNQLVTFQKMTTAGIGNLLYINMSSAPTTAALESGEELPIFTITNANGRLYDRDTTIGDMGLYNWMYFETQTEEGYSYDVVASWEGYAAFTDTTTIAKKIGAYVAGYDTEGKLVEVSPFLIMHGTTQKLTMTSDTKINEIRIFVWGGTSTDNIFGELVPVLPSMNAMKVQTLKPATSGFVAQAD